MLKRLHHVRFKVKDLAQLKEFALDFGLIPVEETSERLVMRALGGDTGVYIAEQAEQDGLVGFAFEVENRDDLDFAVNELGATAVAELDLPCGGHYVTLIDPDGNQVDLIHGVARIPEGELEAELLINTPANKVRFGKNQTTRNFGPARLWRIGHIGIFVKSYAASSAWYSEKLGLIGSDVYNIPGQPQAKIVGFHRMNRGNEYVDHHVVALMQDERGGCHHISFEVLDYEAQLVTHSYLQAKEYESIWGVGRHPHGSHVFDVWRSPDGARFETFSDTDLFREEDGTNYHDISTVVMDKWSTEPPDKYFI
ncbi:VOC family protein [Arenicella xantha]|uniref:Catechol-2,3-dioxygenase n=1 Tax=Arenicella xantha TaxID=644221 RepID=A0A395JFY7_9GAMM|nr:VOC family protein [Arenicella xantha]RBP47192.1 catechol-2,3-dioxygenase [Arenicella xantha]